MSARRPRPASKKGVRWGLTVATLVALVMGGVGSVIASPPLSHVGEVRVVLSPHPTLSTREPSPLRTGGAAVGVTVVGTEHPQTGRPPSRVDGDLPRADGFTSARQRTVAPAAIPAIANYTVEFNESGLTGSWKTTWCVTFNGSQLCSKKNPIDFTGVVNGTYNYTIGHLANYTLNQSYNGSLTVAGGSPGTVSNIVDLRFSLVKYLESFVETGLPKNTNWSVTLSGKTKSTTSKKITFPASNGTYPFGVGVVQGYRASPPNGNVTVQGSNATQSISFNSLSSGGGGRSLIAYYVAGAVAVLAVAVIIGLVWRRRRRRAAQAASTTPVPVPVPSPTAPPEPAEPPKMA